MLVHLAGDFCGRDVEGRHHAGGAVALAIMGPGLGTAGLHRQGFPRLPQRLDPRLRLLRDDHSVVGRVDVEADDAATLRREPRVAGNPECPDPVRFLAVVLQDAEHRQDGNPRFLRHPPQRPVTGVRRRPRRRKRDPYADLVRQYRHATPYPEDVVRWAANTRHEEAIPPAPNRRLRHAGDPHRPRQGEAGTEVKDDGRPLHMLADRCGSVLIRSRRTKSSSLGTIRGLLVSFATPAPAPTLKLRGLRRERSNHTSQENGIPESDRNTSRT